MYIYSSCYGYGASTEKRPFCKDFAKKTISPEKKVVKEGPIMFEAPSNIEVSTSSEVDYYVSLHRILTSRFHSDYQKAMDYAEQHPEDVVTTRAYF